MTSKRTAFHAPLLVLLGVAVLFTTAGLPLSPQVRAFFVDLGRRLSDGLDMMQLTSGDLVITRKVLLTR